MGAQTRSGSGLPEDVVLPDRYRILRRIARGGMATVWCAADTALGRAVAIKLLAEQFQHDDGAMRRFEREARAAARLSGHPNVVTIYDVGETLPSGDAFAGRPFIVMEYLSGGTVADALRVGELSPAVALGWIEQAAAALDFAHGRGVVHRDIKPGNLLLDPERRLHVADFGIARVGLEDTITATGQLFGTAAYLSPEQALGKPATEASDRYALAVVAYELLVGERPFAADSFAGQARQHIEQQPPRASRHNDELPPAIDDVLARGIAKHPEDRWDSAGAFAGALASTLSLGEVAQTSATRPLFVAGRPRGPGTGAQGSRAQSGRARGSGLSAAPEPVLLTAGSGASRGRVRSRALALAALAAVAVAVGIAAAATDTGGNGAPTRTAAATAPRAGSHKHAAVLAARTAQSSTTASTTSSTTSSATGVPAAAPTPPPTADTLEARGHQQMLDGNYTAAIATLQQAVTAAGPGTLTYAYALFDLGRSLRLAGNPQAAAVILQRRLMIPNQTDIVRHELELALRAIGAQFQGAAGQSAAGQSAAGQSAAGQGPAGQGPPGHGHHHGNGQGDGGD